MVALDDPTAAAMEAEETCDPVSAARRMAKAAHRMAQETLKKLDAEEEDPWERELGMDEAPYNQAGEDFK